jgi:hypothetical protein
MPSQSLILIVELIFPPVTGYVEVMSSGFARTPFMGIGAAF